MRATIHISNAIRGAAMLLLAGSTLLSGCAIGGLNTPSSAPSTLAATPAFGGTIHGGQQPVAGATVILWAAGTTGTYGTGATNVASGTTNSNGEFSLNSGGASLCTTGQHLYVTATGGNPGLTGNNSYIALMAALPTPCNSSTGSVFIN